MPPPDATDSGAPPGLAAERLPPPADRLPTLTEVVLLGSELVRSVPELAAPPPLAHPPPGSVFESSLPADTAAAPELLVHPPDGLSAASLLASALPGSALPDAQALTQQVLAELAPCVDALFEARLREALAPALARAADMLIRQSREELSQVLAELVQEAVGRALRQHRPD